MYSPSIPLTPFDQLKNRQRFIGITDTGVCVRCIAIKLFTGRQVRIARADQVEVVNTYSTHIFPLEKEFRDSVIVGVK